MSISLILKVESMSTFPRRIDVIISTWIRLSKSINFDNFPPGISTWNLWRIDENMSIGYDRARNVHANGITRARIFVHCID